MALLICPDCGAKVSTYAQNCMQCGMPVSVMSELLDDHIELEEIKLAEGEDLLIRVMAQCSEDGNLIPCRLEATQKRLYVTNKNGRRELSIKDIKKAEPDHKKMTVVVSDGKDVLLDGVSEDVMDGLERIFKYNGVSVIRPNTGKSSDDKKREWENDPNVCSNCGTLKRSVAKYCHNCGQKL